MTTEHRELTCTNPRCTYDLRRNQETKLAVIDYLVGLSADVDDNKVRDLVEVLREDLPGQSSTA